MLWSRLFGQYSFLDDFIYICRRQRQTGIKPSLDLRKVIAPKAHVLGNGVNILLAGYNDPRLALAGSAQILRYRLEIQHQLRVIAYVLSDFIHQENDMVVVAFTLDIFLHQLSKIFDADLIAFRRLFTPVTGGGFAHETHIVQNINDVILGARI